MPITPEIEVNVDLKLARAPSDAMHVANKGYVDTGLSGKSATSHNHTATDITDLGTAATSDTGTSSGNIPVLDTNGKIPLNLLPGTSLTNSFVSADETSMLALSADMGDISIRTDVNKTFILAATPATTLANWLEVLTPTSAVTSVNGSTGPVTISVASLGAASSDHNHDSAYISVSAKGAASGVASLGADTKVPIAQIPTAAALSDSATTVPTTAAVNTAIGVLRYSTTINGNGSTTSFDITHNLGTVTPDITLYRNAGTEQSPSWIPVVVAYSGTSSIAATIEFAVAPASGTNFTVIARK